jgi:hypothetical protein
LPFDTINGVALKDSTRRWTLHKSTSFHAEQATRRQKNDQPGRHGYAKLPATDDAVAYTIGIIHPTADYETLAALVSADEIVLEDSVAGRAAVADLANFGPRNMVSLLQGYAVFEAIFDIPGVFARDADESTTDPAAISSASVVLELFEGISGYVDDAVVRVKGGVTGLRVTDSAGSWFEYEDELLTSEWLRFDSATGKAWITTSDTWTGGTEVTGLIDNGPGDYPLLITPFFTNPDDRVAQLTVTSSARSGSPTIEVRGKSAYRI